MPTWLTQYTASGTMRMPQMPYLKRCPLHRITDLEFLRSTIIVESGLPSEIIICRSNLNHDDLANQPVSEVHQHSAAERRYRDSVSKQLDNLRQCLTNHGTTKPGNDSDNDRNETHINKVDVLATATDTIKTFRRHMERQQCLIMMLESRSENARNALKGEDEDEDEDDEAGSEDYNTPSTRNFAVNDDGDDAEMAWLP